MRTPDTPATQETPVKGADERIEMATSTHIEPRLPIPFTIDGQRFTINHPSQLASELLRLAGLDPASYDLGELEGKEGPRTTKRFASDQEVKIRKDAQFVSIRHKAEVAGGRMMSSGTRAFVNRMAELGFNPVPEGNLVIYRVIPVGGAHDGCQVETGVSVDELVSWPDLPPHFIHLPASIRFSHPPYDTSPKSGWRRHSRKISEWGNTDPGVHWASNIRAVLCAAIA